MRNKKVPTGKTLTVNGAVTNNGVIVKNGTITNTAGLGNVVDFNTSAVNGLTVNTIMYAASGQKIPDSNATVPAGYSSLQWNKDMNGSTLWNFENDSVSEPMTLYAKGTVVPYTVTYAEGQNGTIDGTYADVETVYNGTIQPESGYALPTAITVQMGVGGANFTDFNLS